MITSTANAGQCPAAGFRSSPPAPVRIVPLTLAPLRPAAARAACAAALAFAAPAAAQQGQPDIAPEAVVGSDAEHYLRALQVAGVAPLYPWSIRGFSPSEVDRLVPEDDAHPWARRLPTAGDGAAPRIRLIRPSAGLVYNSAFPQGSNDGALWAGRGLTASASAGVQLRAGPLTVRLEPMVFWAQNQSFDLMPNGRPDSLRFLDPHTPATIDLPQRPGDGSFARLHPGQSSVRLDGRGFAFGFSTANQQWGPAIDQPLVLGPNGAGFPHVFLGSSNPWKIGIGRLHGRIVWGSLWQSSTPPPASRADRRFMSGIVGVFLPYGLDGLEIGILRFFHDPWPENGIRAGHLARPLEDFFKVGLDRDTPGGPEGSENQLASAFVRWVLPRGGVEVYGEYTREDYSWDWVDAILEPDRASGYMVGGRKVWTRGASLLGLRMEWVDTQRGHINIAVPTGNFYRHGVMRQGHTVGGQLLGSPAGYGGGGHVIALERHTPRGRWSVDWTRTRVASPIPGLSPVSDPEVVDVIHSLGGEMVMFRGGLDAVARLRGSWELNRYFEDDAFNLNASLGVRIGL